ncbi:MAG: phosphopantetheine-binding protein [Spirochaetota bacterium]|nr:phosphopantetheine-binding protein [Spirochaetota bacterium]
MEINTLTQELKDFFIETLDLEDIDIENIDENKSLMSEEFDVNSIDLLELTVALEKKYHIKIGNVETAQKVFQSFRTLAEFIIQKSN